LFFLFVPRASWGRSREKNYEKAAILKETRNRIILAAAVILIASLPLIENNYYFISILCTTGLYIILATGLNVLLGYAGLVSLGQAGFYAIGAYASGILVSRTGAPFLLGLLLAVLLSGLIGLIIGLSSVRLKGGYLAMVTLGFGSAVQIIMINWEDLTGGAEGIWGIPPIGLGPLKIVTPIAWYYTIFFIAGIIILFTYSLERSRIGRAWMALREDVAAVQMMGVNPVYYRLLAFVVSAVYSGIAGALFTHLNGSVFADAFSVQTSILILLMVILGGSGHIMGPIVGAVIVNVGFEVLRPFGNYQSLVFGFLIVLMAIFMPQGFMGLWRRLGALWGHSPKPGEADEPSGIESR
jgi:branched-chain amino acid transport system permease protein